MGLKISNAFLSRFNFGGLYNTFLGLQQREQMFALIGVGFILLLLIGLPLSLASGKLGGLEEEIQNSRQTQRDIVRALERYEGTKEKWKLIEGQMSKGFDATITTTMATIAEKLSIKNRLDNIQDRGSIPSDFYDEVSVEVRLSQLSLPQVIEYLYNVEHNSTALLKIKEIRIKRRYDNKQLLDVSLLASTYRLQEATVE